MISSSISGITIKDSPVQVCSINSAQDLTLTGVTIDNSAGDVDELGHNTDAFDVGSSTEVTISGANVKNQDDCLTVNSRTVRSVPINCPNIIIAGNGNANAVSGHHFHWWQLLWRTWSIDWFRGWARR